MLYFHWECIYYKLNKIKKGIVENYVSIFFFTNIFGRYGNKEGKNIRHYISDFLLDMAVPLEDYYLSMKYEY